ncbi:hypothetical protein V1477_020939 [Vespula maculifrons]|uniref:Uncharacterized protein n=1 Tax=Vespula maculifrons TaxID=7453 RepID=A0ABD2ANC5_VESMC
MVETTFDRGESCYTGDCERMHDTFVARNPTSSLHLSVALDDDDDDNNDNDDNNDDDNEDDNDEDTSRIDKDAGSTRCTFKSMEEKEKDDEEYTGLP